MKSGILECLCYFDVFNHPLTKDEIRNLCNNGESASEMENAISELVKKGKCYSEDGFFSINKNVKDLISDRTNRENEAQRYFKKLPFYSKIIRSFPFVKAIAISGSLSKNVMFDDGDIDYFIITSPNRLWICRTLLILFKKIFLLNSKRYFCINYFVDENNLIIPDKNIFTAIEITYLMPVYNELLINRFKKANGWIKTYFPNFNHPLEKKIIGKSGFIKSGIEYLFNNSLGNKLDLFFMKLTFNRWKKKFKNFADDKFDLTMRTNRGISKHHPHDFQKKVLEEYTFRIENLNNKK